MNPTEKTASPAPIEPSFSAEVRALRRRFLETLEPHREDLHRFCRALTGSAWDAEDLVQEALLRGFTKLADIHWTVEKPRSWLFRVASNCWTDRVRRASEDPLPEAEAGSESSAPLGPELRQALVELAVLLPPQERAALLLKEAFDFRLAEVAELLGTSVGAVKSALHRARTRLETARSRSVRSPSSRSKLPSGIVDAWVEAFNAGDIDALTELALENVTAEVVGQVQEYGLDQARDGSLRATLCDENGRPRAQRIELFGEPVVLLWYEDEDGESVRDVWRFEAVEGRLSSMRSYYFCPELLVEIGREAGLTVRTNGRVYG